MATTVRISDEHNQMLEEYQSKVDERDGFEPTKKDLVEKAIEGSFGDGE